MNTKEEVNELVSDLRKTARSNYSYRLSLLDDLVNRYNLHGQKRVEKMRDNYGKDAERIYAFIQQTGDRRNAKLDRDAADAAKALYQSVQDKATLAGKTVSKLQNKRNLTMQDVQSTTDAEA